MSKHLDQFETRAPEIREKALFDALPGFLKRTLELSETWREHLGDIDPNQINTREALAQLPVLRKSDLHELQKVKSFLGGLNVSGSEGTGRIFMSPGPIFEPEGRSEDWWRSARALYAAGFRRGDVVHNAFGYHLTPGGFIMDAGARALGCTVIPAGVGNTEMQVEAIDHLKPSGYSGTPDFLKVLLDKAQELGKDTSSLTKALVSGAALPPSLRSALQDRGVRALQAYATADVGVIAYESDALEGMIVEEAVILEIVRPGTGIPVSEGEVGEVVVTSFNRDYPMIRFATGDLSAVMPGVSSCGRTNMRIKGWLGRADQTTKVKGMFIHPSQIAEIGKNHNDLGRLRLVVTREDEQDVMTLHAESSAQDGEMVDAIAQSLQAITKMRGRVELVGLGALPNDGKVIADERQYD